MVFSRYFSGEGIFATCELDDDAVEGSIQGWLSYIGGVKNRMAVLKAAGDTPGLQDLSDALFANGCRTVEDALLLAATVSNTTAAPVGRDTRKRVIKGCRGRGKFLSTKRRSILLVLPKRGGPDVDRLTVMLPARDLAHVKFAQCGRHLHSLAVVGIDRIDSLLQKGDVVRSINGTSNQDMVAMAVGLDRVTVKLERHSDRGVLADAEVLWPRCWIKQARRVSFVRALGWKAELH